MENLDTTPTAETPEQEALAYINGTIAEETEKGSLDAKDIAEKIEENTKGMREETRAEVGKYIDGIEPHIEGSTIDRLPQNIGGQYDGEKITIAAATLSVHNSIGETLRRVEETGEHEKYHEEHEHTEDLQAAPDAEGEEIVTIGGKKFTQTELIEGLTVQETGEEFVSTDYKNKADNLRTYTASVGISLEQLRAAVNKEKDVTLLDDRVRKLREAANTPVDMAA